MSIISSECIKARTYIIGNALDHRLALTTKGNRNENGPVYADNTTFLWDIAPIQGSNLYSIWVSGGNHGYLSIDSSNTVKVDNNALQYNIVFLGAGHYKIVNPSDENVFECSGLKNPVKSVPHNEDLGQEWIFKKANKPMGAYSAVDADFFLQDNLNSDRASDSPIFDHFGLEDSLPDRWSKFWAKITALNKQDAGVAIYKVVFLARACEAVYEYAMQKYGFKAWFTEWAQKDSDSDLHWVDADVTQKGYLISAQVQAVWATKLAAGLGLPQISYCSPLTRALVTNTLTFSSYLVGEAPKLKTVVVKNCCEHCTTETPEKQGTKAYISSLFPQFTIEDRFAERDPIWSATKHESPQDIDNRVLSVLDKAFKDESGMFISITAHSAFVKAFMRIIGRQGYLMRLGGVVPIVVKYSL